MKLEARRIAAFVENPGTCRAVLLYGEDTGLIRARADTLTRAIAGSRDDPFRVAALERATLDRLAEEATAQSLIGGRRVVRVRDVADTLTTALKKLLETPADCLIVLEAPGLPARSKLRTLLDAHPNGAAIGCYPEEGRALAATIEQTLRTLNVTIDADALVWLQTQLGADQALTRNEVEKLALFCRDPGQNSGRADLAAAQACIGDGSGASLDEALFAATSGDLATTDRALAQAMAEGSNPVAIIRTALSHMQRLHRARATMAGTTTASEAAAAMRPPVFFRRLPAFTQALTLWPSAALSDQLSRLFEAEQACKRTGAPAEAIAAAALMRIAGHAAALTRARTRR